MNRIHAELRYWRAVLAEWSYVVRPYDMLADRRHWCWQDPTRCGRVLWASMDPAQRTLIEEAVGRKLDTEREQS